MYIFYCSLRAIIRYWRFGYRVIDCANVMR